MNIEDGFASWREVLEHESSTGKMYMKGFDKEGHGILYMKPGKENSTDFEGTIKFVIFSMDAAIRSVIEDGRRGNTYTVYYLPRVSSHAA